jgi:hypothetical protein
MKKVLIATSVLTSALLLAASVAHAASPSPEPYAFECSGSGHFLMKVDPVSDTLTFRYDDGKTSQLAIGPKVGGNLDYLLHHGRSHCLPIDMTKYDNAKPIMSTEEYWRRSMDRAVERISDPKVVWDGYKECLGNINKGEYGTTLAACNDIYKPMLDLHGFPMRSQ